MKNFTVALLVGFFALGPHAFAQPTTPIANARISGNNIVISGGTLTIASGASIIAESGSTVSGFGGGGGGVSSVAMTVPTFLSVSGSPITGSGTLAVSLSGTALPASSGGTGQTSLTTHSILTGNGTGAVILVAPGSNGNVLTSNGTAWTSSTRAGAAM